MNYYGQREGGLWQIYFPIPRILTIQLLTRLPLRMVLMFPLFNYEVGVEL